MSQRGFTLIEVLIVVVIIGIIVAFAIPNSASTKEKAYITSMKSDLRNLVGAEEAYYADSGEYTKHVGHHGLGAAEFEQTTGNSKPHIDLTPDGWTAWDANVNTTETCVIFVGSTPLAPATKEGEPRCQ